MRNSREDWEVRNDVDTLKRAREIQADSSRMADAQNYIKEQRRLEDGILRTKTSARTPGIDSFQNAVNVARRDT